MRGKVREDDHRGRQAESDPNEVPRVSLDYCFLGRVVKKQNTELNVSELASKSPDDENLLPVLVIVDEKTGCVFSGVVAKGVNAYANHLVVEALKFCGRQRAVLMTDAEPSIKALAEAASKEWGGECQFMTAPRGSHASNSACERAILELARQARTLVSSLEERFPGFKLNPKDKHYPWLIRQASWLLTRYLVKADGKTPYERLRGRTYKGSIIEPFESCHYKVADAEKGKLDAQTNTGIWLGKSLQSDEHLVATEHGIRRCRTIWRKPERLRWNLKGFQSWVGLTWQPRGPPTPTPEAIRSGVTRPGTPVPGTPGVKKGVYTTVGQQLKHGMTPGCPGCHSSDEHPKRHHAECRARFEKLISEERLKLKSKEVLDVEMGAGTSASSRPSVGNTAVAELPAGNTAAVGELPAGTTAATGKSSAGHTAMTSPSAGNTATADGSVAGRPAPVEGPLEGTSMGSEAKRLKKDQSSRSKRPAETSLDDLSAEIERRSVAVLLEAPQEEVDYNDRPTPHEIPLAAYPEWAEVGQVLDERSGEVLEPDKVKKARGRELEKMETHDVKKDIRLSEAKSRGLKIIRSRWVDVKKALPEDPQGVRSRCVAQEINMGPRDDAFAGTPPLWVHRMVIRLPAHTGRENVAVKD